MLSTQMIFPVIKFVKGIKTYFAVTKEGILYIPLTENINIFKMTITSNFKWHDDFCNFELTTSPFASKKW